MEQIIGVLIIAGIIAVSFYVTKKNRSDTPKEPKIGGGSVKHDVDIRGDNKL
jgi:hypothetical protein